MNPGGIELPPREDWTAALLQIDSTRLLALAEKLSTGLTIRPKTLPQAGLGMIPACDSALGERFYLGEIPMSSCWLAVTTENNQQAEGASVVMDDRAELAEAVALCDAILSARLPGWQEVAALVNEGAQQKKTTDRERKAILARTRVDFSLLDAAEDGHA